MMVMKTTLSLGVVLCACVGWATAQISQLGLYEGDICKQEGSTLWTCKRAEECASARVKWQRGVRPEVCSFRGRVPVICCEPDRPTPTQGTKSEQMCKKYGEAVYVEVSQGWSGGVQKEDTCVVAEPLITQGQVTRPREFPHMALVGFGRKDAIAWLCGGSLISERFVMSAAHCSRTGRGPAQWVRLGEYNKGSTRDDGDVSSPMDFEIAERIIHPGYATGSQGQNDIALFRLSQVVQFNEYMRPACLQTKHQFSKTYAVATGWGTTEYGKLSDILLKVNLTLTPSKECREHYESLFLSRGGINDELQLCAGDLTTGKDTCGGDSGGPLQLRMKDPYCMYSVIGIVSFGPRDCGDGSRPGVYTRVSHYVPWIESIVWP